MASDTSGVHVRLESGSLSQHETASRILATDSGHLIVKDARDRVVAIHAPGRWKSAEVMQEPAERSTATNAA
jgi:hypothetical protein